MMSMPKEFRSRPCPVCGSTDDSTVFAQASLDEARLNEFSFASRKFPELMHLRLVLCPVCGLLYATPAPKAEFLDEAYREAKYDSASEAKHAARTYIDYLSKILPQLPDLDGALDIGAGDGSFIERLLAAGFRGVTGVEPSEAPLQTASAEIRKMITCGVFSRENYTGQRFSLISCFQTLEHLEDPRSVCAAAYDLLKPGGAFFTVSHNYSSLSARILGTKSPIYDIEHLQLFSPESIGYLFEKTGFTRVKVFPIANSYPLPYWVKLLPLNQVLKKWLMSLLETVRLDCIPLPLPAGNMVALGYKP